MLLFDDFLLRPETDSEGDSGLDIDGLLDRERPGLGIPEGETDPLRFISFAETGRSTPDFRNADLENFGAFDNAGPMPMPLSLSASDPEVEPARSRIPIILGGGDRGGDAGGVESAHKLLAGGGGGASPLPPKLEADDTLLTLGGRPSYASAASTSPRPYLAP